MISHYDISKPTNYLDRQMFLDPAGPVTVQRFEEVAYPAIQKYDKTARGFFWVPEEISLQKDKNDFKNADEATRFSYTETLTRQTVLDGGQGRAPAQVFLPVVSVPELECLILNWSFFETCIPSNSYSHIIRNVFNMPKDVFNKIHGNPQLIQMSASVGKYYDHLYNLNCKSQINPKSVSEKEHIDAIWMALNASYGLEAIRFLCSFAVSFGFAENGIFMGNGNIISLIMQDELLHMEWTAYLINQVVKDDPRFAEAKIRNEDQVYQLYTEVIQEEYDWADYLFHKGVVVGLNSSILKTFINHMATTRLKNIGIKWKNPVKINPLPWFQKHMNISRKQVSLQEQESTNYIIGALTPDINIDDLIDF